MIQQLPTLNELAQSLARFDLDLPPRAAGALATWRAANDTANADPVLRITEGVRAGTINADTVAEHVEDAARILAAKKHAHEVVQTLTVPLLQTASQSIQEAAEDLIRGLRPHFDQAAANLATAIDLIGTQPDARWVGEAGPAAATAFQTYKESIGVLDRIRMIRRDIAQATRNGDIDERGWFVANLANREALDESRLCRTWTDFLEAGFALHLNTPLEVENLLARVRNVEEAARAADQAAKEAEKAERARMFEERWRGALDEAAAPADVPAAKPRTRRAA